MLCYCQGPSVGIRSSCVLDYVFQSFLGSFIIFFCHHPLNLVFLSCYEDESNGGKNQASVILFCTQFTFACLLGDQEGARKQKLGSKRVGDKNEGRDWLGRQERSVVLQQYDLM